MYYDPSGHIAFFVVTAIIGAVVGFGLATYNDYSEDGVWFNGSVGSYIGYRLGGAAIGAVCGLGAGLGGMAFAAASEVANLACVGYMALGVTASFAGGFAGNLVGTVYTSWHRSGFKNVDINWGESLATSAIMGSLNILAGIGSAMSSIAGSMGRVATDVNSKFALRFLAGLIAGGTEATYDLTSYLIGKLISSF